MRKALEERNILIRRRFTEKVEDLDFADHLALLSNTGRPFRLKTDRLLNASQETGPKINVDKTKVMRFNAENDENVMIKCRRILTHRQFRLFGDMQTGKNKSSVL